MNSAPVFKETVTKTHAGKIAPKGYVFLVATAEAGGKVHTAHIEVLETIKLEERKALFAHLWMDLKPRVQGTVFKSKVQKEDNVVLKKVIAYAILGIIIIIILLCALL